MKHYVKKCCYKKKITKKYPKRIGNLFYATKKSRGKRVTQKIVNKYPTLFPDIV